MGVLRVLVSTRQVRAALSSRWEDVEHPRRRDHGAANLASFKLDIFIKFAEKA